MKVLADLVGSTLSGRYRVVARIAGGGMGEVYRTHDLLLDRAVAVKVLQPSLARDPDLVERFKNEARAAARLAHPNVVAVHDWGSEDESTYYMVMEYVPGSDLRDLLVSRGWLEPAQAVEVMISVCEALAAAHARGLVHRDVKPENILIAPDGTVKVADFGIAAVAEAERTAPGSVFGTLRYLAPEQARGLDATPMCDVWAAGAVLAELLTGRPPLQGAGGDMLQRRRVEQPVAPSGFDPTIPEDLDTIVLKACALEPGERFASARDMAQELRRAAVRSVADAAPVTELLDDFTTELRFPDMEPTSYIAGRKRKSHAPGGRRVTTWALVCLLVVAAALVSTRVFVGGDVVVPSLVSLSHRQAAARAGELGLDVEIADKVRHRDLPEGAVVSQRPRSGSVPEGATVRLVLSAGPPRVRVPDLVGVPKGSVGAALERVGLRLGKVERSYSLRPEGQVVVQKPRSGKLEPGERVDVVVSIGPEPIELPGVAGRPADQAEDTLAALGLVVSVQEAFSDEVDAGLVIATTPGAGETVPEGSSVVVIVSKGPQYDKFRMPDVRGMDLDAARARLQRLGLHVTITRSCGPGGTTVAETDPLAGTMIYENSSVKLFVC